MTNRSVLVRPSFLQAFIAVGLLVGCGYSGQDQGLLEPLDPQVVQDQDDGVQIIGEGQFAVAFP